MDSRLARVFSPALETTGSCLFPAFRFGASDRARRRTEHHVDIPNVMHIRPA
jgi:hypothetical protein